MSSKMLHQLICEVYSMKITLTCELAVGYGKIVLMETGIFWNSSCIAFVTSQLD